VRKTISLAMAALTAITNTGALEAAPYYRRALEFGSPTPIDPTVAPNPVTAKPVEGVGDLKIYGPISVRARTVAPFDMDIVAGNADGAVTWTSVGTPLPDGLSMDANGHVSGTPSATGTTSGIRIQGVDAAGKKGSTQPFSIVSMGPPVIAVPEVYTVAAGGPVEIVPRITNAFGSETWSIVSAGSAPGGAERRSTERSVQRMAADGTGGAAEESTAGQLPVGVSLAAPQERDGVKTVGKVTGKAEQKGEFQSLVLVVTDADNATGYSNPFTIKVDSTLSIENFQTRYPLRQGRSISVIRPNVTGSGGTPIWSLSGYSAPLPEGLTLASDGAISGIPRLAGRFPGISLNVVDSSDRETVSSARATFDISAAPILTMDPVQYLRGPRYGAVSHVLPFTVGNLLGGGRWFVDGDLPSEAKLDVDTGKVTAKADGSRTSVPDLSLRVIDLFDGGTAQAPFSIETLPPLYVDNNGYRLVAERGWFFDFRPDARGVVGSAKWSISGALPDGLRFDQATGAIKGTPTDIAPVRPVVVTLTDDLDGKTANGDYTVSVVPILPLGIQPVRDQEIVVGGRIDLRPTAQGVHGAVAWKLLGERPEWLGFSAETGRITGVTDAIGTYGPFTLSISDEVSGEVPSNPFTITYVPAPLRLSFPIPGATMGVDYDSGTPTFSYAKAPYRFELVTGKLPKGLAMAEATGRITGKPEVSGPFPGLVVKATDADGRAITAGFSLSVGLPAPLPGKPTPSVRVDSVSVASGSESTLVPSVTGFAPTAWADTGATPLPAWVRLNAATGELTLAPTAQGVTTGHQVTATGSDGGHASNPFGITVTKAPGLSVSNATVPEAVIGREYLARPASVAGNPTGLSWYGVGAALPAGLALNGLTGEVHGIPTGPAATVTGLKLRAVNALGLDGVTSEFSIKVVQPGAPGAAFAVSVPPLADAQVGVDYASAAPTVSPATPNLAWSGNAALPPGLSVNPATGAIAGKPTVEGTFPGIVAVSMKVKPAVPAPEPSVTFPAVSATWGKPIAEVRPVVVALPGVLAYAAPAALPQGLRMDPVTGAITGTPTRVTTETGLVATVTAGAATIASAPFDATVVAPALTVSSDGATKWFTGVRSVQAARVEGAMGHVSFRLVKGAADVTDTLGAIAPGLAFNPTDGSISGTPTTAAVLDAFKIVAQDAGGPRTRESSVFSIAISDGSLRISPLEPSYVTTYKTALRFPAPTVAGSGTLTWSLAEGRLPAWARLNADGSITGTPASPSDIGTATGLRLKLSSTASPVPVLTETFALIVERPALAATGPTGTIAAWSREPLAATTLPSATGLVGTVSWSLQGTVPGLRFDPVTLLVTGSPTTKGLYEDLALVATDSFDGKTAKSRFALKVSDRPTELTLTTDKTVYSVRAGAPLRIVPKVVDDTPPVVWSRPGNLPAWAAFSASDGSITGTPPAVGTIAGLVVAAEDSKGLKGRTEAFSIEVTPGIGISGLAASYNDRKGKGRANAIQLAATGTDAAVAWSAAGLPKGLELTAGGLIGGTPTESGTFLVTVTATDPSDGATASATTTFLVERELMITMDPLNFVARTGKAYVSVLPGIVGLRGTATWSVVGTLPSWATPDAATGALRGPAPATVGETTGLRLKARDDWDGTEVSSDAFSLRVLEDLGVVDMATSYAPVFGFPLRTGAPRAINAAGTVAWGWGIGTRPAWAGLDAKTGVITGTPDALANNGPLTIVATDATGATAHSVAFSLNVRAKPTVALDVASNAFFQKRIGDTLTFKATPQGLVGAAVYSLVQTDPRETMPAGLSVAAVGNDGVVVGNLTGVGNAKIAVRVTDATTGAYVDSSTVQVEVIEALTVSGLAANYGARGNTFLSTDTPAVTGNRGKLTYALSIPVPSGMTFDATGFTGILKGIPAPSVTGTWNGTKLTVTDAYDNRSASASFDLKILGPLAVSGQAAFTIRNGSDIATRSFTPAATNVLSPTGLTWKAAAGATIPTGTAVDPRTGKLAGVVTGYAATTPLATVRVTGTDADNLTVTTPAVTATVYPTFTATLAQAPIKTRVGLASTLPAATAGGKVGTVSWRIVTTAGQAPANAAVSAAGVTTFTADTASVGTWTFQLEATDAADSTKALTDPVSVETKDVAGIQMADIVVRASGSRKGTPVPSGNLTPIVEWTASGLPAWASIDKATGEVTASPPAGTAAVKQTVAISARETDGAVGTKSFVIDAGARPTLSYSRETYGGSLYVRAGEDYAGTEPVFLTAKGAVSYAMAPASGATCLGELPAGLQVTAATGLITGQLPAGTANGQKGNYCVMATDAYDGATAVFSRNLQVGDRLSVQNVGQAVNMTVGLEYSLVGKVTGSLSSDGAVTITGSGALPPGISFQTVQNAGVNNGFRFYGTVLNTFTAPVTYTVSAQDRYDGKVLTYAIAFTPRTGFSTSMASVTKRVTAVVSAKPSYSGGTAPYSFAMFSGVLPAGLSLNKDTGEISGRMPTLSTTSYKMRVTDASGREADAPFTMASTANTMSTTATNQNYFYVHKGTPRSAQASKTGVTGTASYSFTPPEGTGAFVRGESWMSITPTGMITWAPPVDQPTGDRWYYNYFMVDSFDGAYVGGQEWVNLREPFGAVYATGSNTRPMSAVLAAGMANGVGPIYPTNLIGVGAYQIVMAGGTANPGFTFNIPYKDTGNQAFLNVPDAEGTFTFSIKVTDGADGATATLGPHTVEIRKLRVAYPAAFEIRQTADLSKIAYGPTVTGKLNEAASVGYNFETNPGYWNITSATGRFSGRHTGTSVGSTQNISVRGCESNGGCSTYTGTVKTTAPPSISYATSGVYATRARIRIGDAIAPSELPTVQNPGSAGSLEFQANTYNQLLPADLVIDAATGRITGKTGTCTATTDYTTEVVAYDSADGAYARATYYFGCAPALVATMPATKAKVGVNYAQTMGVANIKESRSITAVGLPSPLTMDSSGSIRGIPAAGSAGTYPVTVTITDAWDNKPVTRTLDFVVDP
jgi:hypothetical protein